MKIDIDRTLFVAKEKKVSVVLFYDKLSIILGLEDLKSKNKGKLINYLAFKEETIEAVS